MSHKLKLLSSLLTYKNKGFYPWHTPGHKGGRGTIKEFKELFDDAFKADVSIMSEVDNIHNPQGALLEAQKEAANLYGADHSFFSVNGTTGALHALIMGTLRPKDKLLLPRNAHRSLGAALIISGIDPIYIMPDFNDTFFIATQVSPQTINNAFSMHKDIKALLLTSPNYYGLTADVATIEKIVHKNNALLLVDEAHGAHLYFNNKLPQNALCLGADACAQSTHKSLGALTQSSILHIKEERINHKKVQKALSLLTSTSPNTLLLSSIDAALHQMFKHGQAYMDNAIEIASFIRSEVKKIPNLLLLEKSNLNHCEYFELDETKITINVSQKGLTGFQVADMLKEKNIVVELADYNNILILTTYADDIINAKSLVTALKNLPNYTKDKNIRLPRQPFPKKVMLPRDAFFSQTKSILLKEAQGKIAAQEITFYPPGIPIVLPGELITQEIIEHINFYTKNFKNDSYKYIDVVF